MQNTKDKYSKVLRQHTEKHVDEIYQRVGIDRPCFRSSVGGSISNHQCSKAYVKNTDGRDIDLQAISSDIKRVLIKIL